MTLNQVHRKLDTPVTEEASLLGILTAHDESPWNGGEIVSSMYSREQENAKVFPQPTSVTMQAILLTGHVDLTYRERLIRIANKMTL